MTQEQALITELTALKTSLTTQAQQLANQIASLDTQLTESKQLLDELTLSKTTIETYQTEAEEKLEEINNAYDAIYIKENEEELPLIEDIKDSHDKITRLYLGASQTINGYIKTSRGLEIPTAEILKYKDDDYILDETTGKYYIKISTRVPGLVEATKAELLTTNQECLELRANIETVIGEQRSALGQRIAAFENDIARIKDEITALLPSALSAGLAAGYDNAKSEHKSQATFWRWAFALSMILFLTIAGVVTYNFNGIESFSPWENSLLKLAYMLPFEIPVVWFAILSAKKINQYSRLYEEYLHKWSIAKTFAGMSNAVGDAKNSPTGEELSKDLYARTLEAYAYNPSKTFDKEAPSDSPAEITQKAAEVITKAVASVLPTGKPG